MPYTILLVDDNKHLRISVKLYLENKGFTVIAIASVVQALRFLSNQIVDLIITDIVMPNKDGYSFINRIRSNALLIHIPIIVLTAKGMTADRIKGYNLGCSAYLSKPFDPNELISIINNLLVNKQKIINVKSELFPDLIYHNLQKMKEKFTPREFSVLQLVVRGLTNKDISQILHTSKRNVEKYVSRLLSKTHTRNRTELAQYILQDDSNNTNPDVKC
uniref:TctD-like protein n=1 Tax=Hildenbrandia rubra TaxID=31481 RepID=A0A1C9CG75_9FLOR|nr:hypothetical protein Hrub_137 [Hildenbrandia rubra]AOM67381.1 hypothetical protein Hrub_137 [Hildenbrandia rubra]